MVHWRWARTVRRIWMLGAAALLVGAAACGDERSGSDPSPGTDAPVATTSTPAAVTGPTTMTTAVPSAASLAGRWFVADASGVDGRALVDGTQLTMRFTAEELSASAGCNTLTASYRIDESATLVVDQIGATAMGCDAPRHQQDEWLSSFLQSRPTVAIEAATLVLSGGSARITLTDREVADPDRSLEGGVWTLTGVISGMTVAHSLVARPATLAFVEGRLSVDTGCNSGSAAYELAGDTVTVQPLALTRMMCDEATMQQEQAVVGVLAGPMTVTIEAAELTLMNGDDGLVLVTD
jgi:heat shock protein HslJ